MIAERSHTPKGKLAYARILSAAEVLFAERGFHGASMRDVASEAELPLASITYHFATKARLYTAVLEVIADHLSGSLDEALCSEDPREAADGLARALARWSVSSPASVRLLLRELLDNPARVTRASRLPLAPFVQRAIAVVREAGVPAPETAFLHVIGGLSYAVVSRPTVSRIVGAARARELRSTQEQDALAFARRMFGAAR